LAESVAHVTGYSGRIEFDTEKSDGPPRKLLNVTQIAGLGWKARIGLKDGLSHTYAEYIRSLSK